MVNGEVCVGLFAIRDIKKVMPSAESDESFIMPRQVALVLMFMFKRGGGWEGEWCISAR